MNVRRAANGFTLIEVIVAIALGSIFMLVMTSMLQMQGREVRALNERLGGLELQNTLTNVLASGDVCMYVLNPPSGTPLTFNSTLLPSAQPKIDINKIPQVAAPSAPSLIEVGQTFNWSSVPLTPQSISMKILSGSGKNFLGQVQVEIKSDNKALIRSIPPVTVNVTLTADTTNPSAAKVTSCQSKGTSDSDSGTGSSKVDYGSCARIGKNSGAPTYWKNEGLTTKTYPDIEFACPKDMVVAAADGGEKFSFIICCPLK